MGGDCIAKEDSWALSSGPLAVTQPPKVLADGFLPICHQCNLLGHHPRASLVFPQVACWCREKPQFSSCWQCFWRIAHYRGGGGRGSVSRGCAAVPNPTSSDIREGPKIYNADSTPVSSLSWISASTCTIFSTIHQSELVQGCSASRVNQNLEAIPRKGKD